MEYNKTREKKKSVIDVIRDHNYFLPSKISIDEGKKKLLETNSVTRKAFRGRGIQTVYIQQNYIIYYHRQMLFLYIMMRNF